MTTFLWILSSGVLMSAIALVGSVTLLLPERTRQKLIFPLVAFAAGTLLGGAFFHMMPAAASRLGNDLSLYGWMMVGFVAFLGLEQLLHWHHCARASADCRKPLGYMILLGDGLHNFLGGLSVAGTFLMDVRLGITTWLAAAAHEVPQELGDFGVLLHAGWSKRRALLYNILSGLTFLVGGLVAYVASSRLDVTFLVPLAAGNFLYIGASDLVPEIARHERSNLNVLNFFAFIAGLVLLAAIRLLIAD